MVQDPLTDMMRNGYRPKAQTIIKIIEGPKGVFHDRGMRVYPVVVDYFGMKIKKWAYRDGTHIYAPYGEVEIVVQKMEA